MPWADIRQEITAACHEEFGLPATYLENTGVGLRPWVEHENITVRLHSRQIREGDLDRDGFAEFLESLDRIVFTDIENLPFEPKRGDRVAVGSKFYRLETEDSRSDGYISVWDLKESENPPGTGIGI